MPPKLSPEMQRLIDVLKEHGKLVRYDGGFWHIPNCKMRKANNGPKVYYVPIHPTIEYFGYGTIKALKKRSAVIVTKLNEWGDDCEICLC